MLLVVMTRKRCVHNGPTSKTGRVTGVSPTKEQPLYCLKCWCHRQSHSFPPSGSPCSEKGLDPVFLWVGMEERVKPLRVARGWQHETPYSSQEQVRSMGVCGLLGGSTQVTGRGPGSRGCRPDGIPTPNKAKKM